MADRKDRSVTFRSPVRITLGELKAAIEEEINGKINVFQDLGEYVYLLELELMDDAERLISQGFDVDEFHMDCSPPHGKFLNVSIMGLRAYIDDDDVEAALTEYGEIKSEVIRLKYKADHDLAGLENGNRLVKMVLNKPSLPYSMKIGGEWCRIIHNNQQPVCLECQELGHTRKKCPKVKCRKCKQLGHMSFDCEEEDQNNASTAGEETKDTGNAETPEQLDPEQTKQEDMENQDQEENTNVEQNNEMDFTEGAKGLKRQYGTDSDSDRKSRSTARRQRISPQPNLATRKTKETKTAPKNDRKSTTS